MDPVGHRPVTTFDPWHMAADLLDPPPWRIEGRDPLKPHQLPPEGDWRLWILSGGRGAGKTEGAARFFAEWMRNHPGTRGRIIGPRLADVWESCINGPSGLKAMDPDVRVHHGTAGQPPKVIWPNESEAVLVGTWTPPDVDGLRALGNRTIDWWEEMAANRQLHAAWDQARLGLRAATGVRVLSIASTTPRGRKKFLELLKEKGTVVTKGSMFDNPGLDDERKQEYLDLYEGTRLARQEIYGEVLTDIPGAVWLLESINREPPPDRGELVRVVVGVDPAGGGGEEASEMGIVVCGKGRDGRGYVLADRTMRGQPDEICQAVWTAVDAFEADSIVAETNNGGDWIPALLRQHRPSGGAAIRVVKASRSKITRAEPIGAQYEQGKWVHATESAGELAKLEDQMTSWVPDQRLPSPDRMDALVWAATELQITGRPASRRVREEAAEPRREREPRRFAGVRGKAW